MNTHAHNKDLEHLVESKADDSVRAFLSLENSFRKVAVSGMFTLPPISIEPDRASQKEDGLQDP